MHCLLHDEVLKESERIHDAVWWRKWSRQKSTSPSAVQPLSPTLHPLCPVDHSSFTHSLQILHDGVGKGYKPAMHDSSPFLDRRQQAGFEKVLKDHLPSYSLFCPTALFAFWLRSSVVSVLFSLISEMALRCQQRLISFLALVG